MADFRAWLVQTICSGPMPLTDAGPGAETELPDLHTVLGQLIALRQEVNLQTRASRSQQEQSTEALRQLGSAYELLEKSQFALEEGEEASQNERLRPLLKTLVDAHDALSLARREVQRIQDSLVPLLNNKEDSTKPDANPPGLPFWVRWLGLAKVVQQAGRDLVVLQEQRDQEVSENLERIRALVDSILAGYAMSLQRLERALEQHGLEPIACIGELFDPQTMEVVEVVAEPGRTASEVLEEVRRGYFWQGRVFRFAQVKVARPE